MIFQVKFESHPFGIASVILIAQFLKYSHVQWGENFTSQACYRDKPHMPPWVPWLKGGLTSYGIYLTKEAPGLET